MGQCGGKQQNGLSLKKRKSEFSDFKVNSGNSYLQPGRMNQMYDIKKQIRVKSTMLPEIYIGVNKISKQEKLIRFYMDQNLDDIQEIIRIQDKLNHPNLPKVKEYFIHEKQNWIFTVQEVCKGYDFCQQIQNQKVFNEQKAAIIIKQVLSAINFMHKNRIMHRNISSESIFFVQEDTLDLQLQDFDFAVEYSKGEKISGEIYLENEHYKAPEIQKDEIYNQSCDIWSIGMLTYRILTGQFPDLDEDYSINLQQNEFLKPVFKTISKEAQQFLNQTLQNNPNKRLSTNKLLKSSWITKFCNNERNNNKNNGIQQEDDLILPQLNDALQNLKQFTKGKKLRQAVYQFLTTNCMTPEEIAKLQKLFQFMDKDGSGTLSKQELKDGYREIRVDKTDKEIDILFSQISKNNQKDNNKINKEGEEINFQDWLQIASQQEDILSKDRLEQAFKMFDQDGDGQLSIEELKRLFINNSEKNQNNGNKMYQENNDGEKLWKQLVKEFDKDNDGFISLSEFTEAMQTQKRNTLTDNII